MTVKTLTIRDEISALRALILRPQAKSPDQAWGVFAQYMREKHGISDIESLKGQEYLAQFNQSPGMRVLLDYMMKRTP